MPEGDDIIREFDGFRLVRLIGQGGMGRVFLAEDLLLDRLVAIKFLWSTGPTDKARFLNEARTIAKVQHECVVQVFRAGEVAGQPYIVSEYVDGTSLDKLDLPLPWPEVQEIAHEVAMGLSAAHRLGVIHRDIKPANVIRTREGGVKIVDFGIACLATRPQPVFKPPVEADAGATRPVPIGPVHQSQEVALALNLSVGDNARLTRPGYVMGTPAYMAPELLEGREATFASDVYSLGLLMWELLVGAPPERDADLSELCPGIPLRLAEVVNRCLRPDPQERFQTANEVRAALNALIEARDRPEALTSHPYLGLCPFGAEHEAFFFGREAETRAILGRLGAGPVVVVTGDSGLGKSSLCRAGVLPRVPDLPGPMKWTAVLVMPGAHPLDALCAAIEDRIGIPRQTMASAFEEGPDTACRLLRQTLCSGDQPDQGGRGVVFFWDQLEEIFTLGDPMEAQVYARLLRYLESAPPGIKLLATIRVDFLGRLASVCGDAVTRHLYFLRPLTEERLREVIVAPAERLGYTFESEQMVQTLVAAAAGEQASLPLLEFTLERLWEMRDQARKVIPNSALNALGGVEGALGRHGDEVLASLDTRGREAARRVLLRLVTPHGTRAQATREDLCVDGDVRALEVLVAARLVTAREAAGGTVYEIAHEALLRGWDTLRQWIHAAEDVRLLVVRLEQAAKDWDRLGRPRDLLLAPGLLDEAKAAEREAISPLARDFLAASRRARRRVVLGRIVAATAVPLVILGIYMGVRIHSARELAEKVEARLAKGRGLMESLDLRHLDEAEAEAFLAFDAGDRGRGEEVWAEVTRLRNEAASTLSRAEREFETALLLKPSSEEALSLTGRALFERAMLAERAMDTAMFEEVVGRLAVFDPHGQWMAQLHMPGSVPCPEALRRARRLPSGQVALEEVPAACEGGLMRLLPGSYRLTYSGVEVPVLVRRGRFTPIQVEAPKAIPPGFIFVPGGLTLIGSPDEDGTRRGFFHAVPIHEREVGPLFIARHETTFGEYLAYLDTLEDAEREQRLPRVALGGFEGALGLKKGADGVWEIEFRPAGKQYRARAGEVIRYEGRKVRAAQDWTRFPVVGVTAEDAEAYAAWLGATGRVVGARLCREEEWERAARGADGRPYPHGWSLSPDEANYDETYGKVPAAMGPDEVGSHPASASPFGVQDMAGNVWEWTVAENGQHAARGGSYYFDVNSARTYNREVPEPSFRDASVGFRLCADVR